MNEIIATAPWAFTTFALAFFSGLVGLIAYFARLGSRVSGVEKNVEKIFNELREMRDEMRAGFADVQAEFATVNKNLSRLGERVAKTEGRVDGWVRGAEIARW